MRKYYALLIQSLALACLCGSVISGELTRPGTDIQLPISEQSSAIFTSIQPEVSKTVLCDKNQCVSPVVSKGNMTDPVNADSKKLEYQSAELPIGTSFHQVASQLGTKIVSPSFFKDLIAKSHVMLTLVFFALIGLILAFTPCVLPMTAISVSIIAGPAGMKNKIRTVALCLTYVMASSLTFGAIGYLAASSGIYITAYLNHNFFIVTLASLMILMGLVIIGGNQLSLPSKFVTMVTEFSNHVKGGSIAGVIFLAVIGALLISPCALAPIIGIVSYLIITKNVTLGILALFAFGFGLGFPLLVVSLLGQSFLPVLTHRLVKNLNTILGLILLGVGLSLLAKILPTPFNVTILAFFIFLVTIYMGITSRVKKGMMSKLWKAITIVVFFYGVALINGQFIVSTAYNPYSNIKLTQSHDTNDLTVPTLRMVNSSEELDQAFQDAKKNNEPIILDFYADWCVACKRIDQFVWSKLEIQHLLWNFMILRVDLTNPDAPGFELARRYSVSGPPAMLFFDKNGSLLSVEIAGYVDEQQMHDALVQVINAVDGKIHP